MSAWRLLFVLRPLPAPKPPPLLAGVKVVNTPLRASALSCLSCPSCLFTFSLCHALPQPRLRLARALFSSPALSLGRAVSTAM